MRRAANGESQKEMATRPGHRGDWAWRAMAAGDRNAGAPVRDWRLRTSKSKTLEPCGRAGIRWPARIPTPSAKDERGRAAAVPASQSGRTEEDKQRGGRLGNDTHGLTFVGEHPIEIGFNARYLLDIAQQIGDDEAEMLLANGDSPAIIKGMNDKNSLFVIMPVRI